MSEDGVIYKKIFAVAILFCLFHKSNAIDKLPPEYFFTNAIDKADVLNESYMARADARGVLGLWKYHKYRKKVDEILKKMGEKSTPLIIIEWGGGYSHGYHCSIVFQDASALVFYSESEGGKISFIKVAKGNEYIEKYIRQINQITELLSRCKGNLGTSGADKTYFFITFYYNNPWNNNKSAYNSFAFEHSIFIRNNSLGRVFFRLYYACRKQLESEGKLKDDAAIRKELKKALGFNVVSKSNL